ncbi:hypothetical protein EB077_07220, partial [bacterium]|nr:hypothetical protein [bacterium]
METETLLIIIVLVIMYFMFFHKKSETFTQVNSSDLHVYHFYQYMFMSDGEFKRRFPLYIDFLDFITKFSESDIESFKSAQQAYTIARDNYINLNKLYSYYNGIMNNAKLYQTLPTTRAQDLRPRILVPRLSPAGAPAVAPSVVDPQRIDASLFGYNVNVTLSTENVTLFSQSINSQSPQSNAFIIPKTTKTLTLTVYVAKSVGIVVFSSLTRDGVDLLPRLLPVANVTKEEYLDMTKGIFKKSGEYTFSLDPNIAIPSWTLSPSPVQGNLQLQFRGISGQEQIQLSVDGVILKENLVLPTTSTVLAYNLPLSKGVLTIRFINDGINREIVLEKINYNGRNLMANVIKSDLTPEKLVQVRNGKLKWGGVYRYILNPSAPYAITFMQQLSASPAPNVARAPAPASTPASSPSMSPLPISQGTYATASLAAPIPSPAPVPKPLPAPFTAPAPAPFIAPPPPVPVRQPAPAPAPFIAPPVPQPVPQPVP